MDDLDSLLIPGSLYRRWQQDASELCVQRPAPRAAQPGRPVAAAAASTAIPAIAGLLRAGEELPEQLVQLHARAAAPASAAKTCSECCHCLAAVGTGRGGAGRWVLLARGTDGSVQC